MKEQITLLENSFRTNIAMSRAMIAILQLSLAKKYLADAHKDKRLLSVYKAAYNEDATQEYKTIEG